jgi:hypothetical protein
MGCGIPSQRFPPIANDALKHDATQAEHDRFGGVGIAMARPSNP